MEKIPCELLKRTEVGKRKEWEGELKGKEEIMLVKYYSHKQSIARTVKINSCIHSCWQWIPAKLNSSKIFNLDLCGTTLFSSPAYNCNTSGLPGNSQLHYVCTALIFLLTNTSFKIQNISKSFFRTWEPSLFSCAYLHMFGCMKSASFHSLKILCETQSSQSIPL